MTIPPITDFNLKENSLWYTAKYEQDYNLFISDNSNLPDRDCYELLITAEPEITNLIEGTDKYIKQFVDNQKAGIGSTYSVIEIGAIKEEEIVILNVVINYDDDPYSLWMTRFSWDVYNQWHPMSFSRTDW